MERAMAGDEILVTRRGKPTVRLLPVNHQPTLMNGSNDAGGETAAPPASQEA
jgi:prevent-host-death family protein